MRFEKIYIQLFFLLSTILLGGCRLLTGVNTEPETVVEPVYINAFIITSPEKSSFWKPGKVMEIKWITSGSVEKVDIQLYRKIPVSLLIGNGMLPISTELTVMILS